VLGLLTSVNGHRHRVSLHGLRETLLHQQAQNLGLPLHKIRRSEYSSNEEYEEKMRATLQFFQGLDIHWVAFGDLFLEDVRSYRIEICTR
jgi:diphthamide synthase (EF-2-diphthine--ammonia ligase)